MDKEKLGELKIQLQLLLNESQEYVQEIPPTQLYAALGVVLFTVFFFLLSKFVSRASFFFPVLSNFFVPSELLLHTLMKSMLSLF